MVSMITSFPGLRLRSGFSCSCETSHNYIVCIHIVHTYRSIRAKHFLIHEDGVVKLSGLRSITSMIEEGARVKVRTYIIRIL